jgi:hypothetical protein
MKKLIATLTVLLFISISTDAFAQLFHQQFTDPLTAGNEGGGTIISNTSVTSDPVYVNDPASNTQFTYLSTNNAAASIGISGDGVMRLVRPGAGTVYIVRNTNFTGSPTSLMVSFDFFADTTAGTSGGALEIMLGQNFPNSNNNPATTDKHSVFFINTKNPTGTPGTWGITPTSGSSASAFTTQETITWYVNNSGDPIEYTGPDGSTNTVANDTYDLWVADTLFYDDQAATTGAAELNNFEIRIAGGNGTYTVDNIMITEIQTSGGGSELTGHFRTKQSGNWNAPSTWEASQDGVTWTDATVTPYDTSNTITIRNAHTVTVTESVDVDQTTIEEGGTVVVNGTPVVFTISDGGGPVDMLVNGLLKSTGDPNPSPGPHTVNADGILQFGSSGVYEHEQNSGAIPVSVWGTGSTMKLTGTTGQAPANRNQDYHHLIFDTPNLSSNLNMGFNNNVISGDITIVATGATSRWQLCGPPTGETAILDIMGDVIHLGGNFTTHGTGNGNTTIIINHYGNIDAANGNFSIARGSQGGTGTTDWFLFGGNLSLSDLTTQNSNAAGARFVFAGTTEQNLTISNLTYGGGGLPIQVDSGATLNLGTNVIEGNGTFTVNDFGGINTVQPTGFEANVLTTGTVTLSESGNYGYNGTVAQVTGTLVPSIVNNLTINNATGVSMSGGMVAMDVVSVLDGDLNLNGNNLIIGPSGVLAETPGNTVKGTSGKIATLRDINAPSGVNVAGLGAVITSSSNLGGTVVERFHYVPVGNSNEGITRIFNIQPTNNSGLNATLRFYYDESELNSVPEANLILFRSPDGTNNTWDGVGGTVNTTENYVELSGINSFSFWTLGDINNPIPVELSSFSASSDRWNVNLNWITASELNNLGWDIETRRMDEEGNYSEWTKAGFVQGAGNSSQPVSYSYIDKEAGFGIINYRLKQIDFDGTYAYSDVVEIDLGNGPVDFILNQNYPNPFNPSTSIRFEIPENAFVNISVYNAIGEKVSTILNEQMEKGVYTRSFDGSNLSSGIYIYQLTSGSIVLTQKMLMIK